MIVRASAALAAIALSIGAACLAASGPAHARFGAGVIADAAADLSAAQPVQYRQRTYRRAYPPSAYAPPPSTTASPYRYPGSRGALDSCAFC